MAQRKNVEETTVDPEWWAEAKRTIARQSLLILESDRRIEHLENDLVRARSTIGQLRAQLAQSQAVK